MPILSAARGLVTQPSEITRADGALTVANDVVIDSDNIIESRRGLAEFGDSIPGDVTAKQLLTYKGRILRHYESTLGFDSDGEGSFSTFDGLINEVKTGLRIKYVESNGNLYFTTLDGIKKISATSADEFTSDPGYITKAGGVKALSMRTLLKPSSSGWLPSQSKVAYRVVWSIRDVNSNLIIGSPSSRSIVTNTSENINVGEKFNLSVLDSSSISASTYFTFRTSVNGYFVWFDLSGSDTEPTDATTVGRLGIRVDLSNLTLPDNNGTAATIASAIVSAVSEVEITVNSNEIVITNTQGGNVEDPDQGTLSASAVLVSKINDGQTALGTPANVQVTFPVPEEVDNDLYFYQVYRSPYVTRTQDITLNDITPSDEMNLVYESGVTEAEILSGSVVVQDITPETFRNGGTPLYTNPISGQGILQANEKPPVAKDVALFRSSVFYANTQEFQRKQISLISVTDFVSGTSKFFVGNDKVIREYTFVGETEITDFTVEPKSDTVGNSYFLINSSSNERTYKVWMDKGVISHNFDATTDVDNGTDTITVVSHGFAELETIQFSGDIPTGLSASTDYYVRNKTANTFQVSSTPAGPIIDITGVVGTCTVSHISEEPEVADTLSLRVNFTGFPDTATGSANAFIDAFFDVPDFVAIEDSPGVVRVSCTNNGNVDDPTQSTIPTGWSFSIFQQGDGEDALNNEVFLSGLDSVGQSIDETARSLEFVINNDADSPINAFYLSGPDDLPGTLLLESRNLEDSEFYISVSPSAITSKFNPILPENIVLDSISNVTNIFTTTTAHGLSVGNEVYINDNPIGPPTEFGGKYKIATVPTPTTFTLTVPVSVNQPSPLNGSVFLASEFSDNSINPNRIYFSKIGQPEAVPLTNFIDVGPKDKAIQRIIALRDSLIVLKEDGVYVVNGQAAPNYFVRLVDSSANIIAPDSAVLLNNLVYMLSTQGVVTVTETGVSVISRNIENKILEITNPRYQFRTTTFGVAYESDRSYILSMPSRVTDTTATQSYRYNTFTRTWTRWTKPATCGLVQQEDDKLYLGDAVRPYVLQERKSLERQDFADREIFLSFGNSAINDAELQVSSAAEVEEGDVVVQNQYVSIPLLNRFLKKLDRDTMLPGGYFNTFQAFRGDNLAQKLILIVAKLNIDLAPYTLSTPSGVNTLEALQTDYNTMIQGLNNPASGTAIKNYREAVDLVSYEVLVLSVNKTTNILTTNFKTWFIEGNFSLFKSIKNEVEYAPQYFGQPEELKQISEGTFIFDQTNFYSGIVGYASDRSANFVEYVFNQRGPGFWVSYDWANVVWGGGGNEVPVRTLIPQNKSRCRFLKVKYKHTNAREIWRLLGISLEPRMVSTRGYR